MRFRTKFSKTLLCSALFSAVALGLSPSQSGAETPDPMERMNRGTFWLNDKLDFYLLEPIAKGYKNVVAKPIRHGVGGFFRNLKTPVYILSDLIQGKFSQAGTHTGRFLVNTTIGVLGFIDAAKDLGMEHEEEDFGTAMGYHGMGEGFYLVIPILGPSNGRDFLGRLVDGAVNPASYIGEIPNTPNGLALGASALDGINTRARILEGVQTAKEASLDYYAFVRNSYHQHRQNLIYDNNPPEELEEQSE